MPSRNIIKTYVENGYYHIYNRGVEKRRIFQDRNDYIRFLHLLKTYLTPSEELLKDRPIMRLYLINNNLSKDIELLSFCLMPNHFHLLVKQNTKDAITKMMRQILTAYSMYFNRRYKRVGPLFQGRFKAALVENDQYLLHLSRYIHLNPQERGVSLSEFEWSSYLNYLGLRKNQWLNTKTLRDYFTKGNYQGTYKKFTEEYVDETLPNELFIDIEESS